MPAAATTTTLAQIHAAAKTGALLPTAAGTPITIEISPLFAYDEDTFADSWRRLTPKPAIADRLYLE